MKCLSLYLFTTLYVVLTQTCSLCALHMLSAKFVRTAASEHSLCAQVHAACQGAEVLLSLRNYMPVTHCSCHMQFFRCQSICSSLWHLCMHRPVCVNVCAQDSKIGAYLCVSFVCLFVFTEEYNTSIQEKLPLIIGSAAAGMVFLIAVVVIIIVCNR